MRVLTTVPTQTFACAYVLSSFISTTIECVEREHANVSQQGLRVGELWQFNVKTRLQVGRKCASVAKGKAITTPRNHVCMRHGFNSIWNLLGPTRHPIGMEKSTDHPI